MQHTCFSVNIAKVYFETFILKNIGEQLVPKIPLRHSIFVVRKVKTDTVKHPQTV